MSIKIVLLYLLIQFIVQYIAYKPVRDLLFKIHSKYIKTIPWIKIEFVVLNIIVSLFVLLFTGRGGMTGMTNTFASVLLGFVMAIDYVVYIKSIKSGQYYRNQAKKALQEQKYKEDIERLQNNIKRLQSAL